VIGFSRFLEKTWRPKDIGRVLEPRIDFESVKLPNTSEVWRPMVDCDEKYWVSNLGRVAKINHKSKSVRVMRASISSDGYVHVCTTVRGVRREREVHREVLKAFVGPPPEGRGVGRHLNDVSEDNRLENLAWGSPKENGGDASRNYQLRKQGTWVFQPYEASQ
jgi:hypothetical protein